jgi:hypothetical protein
VLPDEEIPPTGEQTPEVRMRIPLPALLAVAACGGSGADTVDARPASADARPATPDATPVTDCEALLGGDPSNRAIVEVVDTFREPNSIPLALLIDDCHLGDNDDLVRGGLFGQGFVPGDRTFRILVDDSEIASDSFTAVNGDAFWYGIDTQTPPRAHTAHGNVLSTPAGWSLHLMNLTGAELVVERVVDPAAPIRTYELLAGALTHGETWSGEVPVDADTASHLRIQRGGDVVFEDNIMFYLSCSPGEWVGGLHAYLVVESNPAFAIPSIAIVYPNDPCAPTAAPAGPARFTAPARTPRGP